MTGRLKNKVAVITGAAAGIGRASALSFAKEGAKVFCVDWDGKGAAETAELVKKADGQAIAWKGMHRCTSESQRIESLQLIAATRKRTKRS